MLPWRVARKVTYEAHVAGNVAFTDQKDNVAAFQDAEDDLISDI